MINLEFLERAVNAIKKAAELISDDFIIYGLDKIYFTNFNYVKIFIFLF